MGKNIFAEENKSSRLSMRLYTELSVFSLQQYYEMIDEYGLAQTWDKLLSIILKYCTARLNGSLLKFDNLSELYEIGLAYSNKIEKKDLGKYYTPKDVASVMAELLLENEVKYLADVGCGTGNLIVQVIEQVLKQDLFDILSFIKKGKLFLYDLDKTALKICVTKISLLVGEDVSEYINIYKGNFLSENISLPKGVSVITNPPYNVVKKLEESWRYSEVMKESMELYAGFIDKILDYCNHAVIVCPQSFLVADKFSKLREKLGAGFSGEVFSFDNVPGTLFNGRKHGIFNTNNANGVRASITNLKRANAGFRLSHLIRFKTGQRKVVLNLEFLRSKLGNIMQDLSLPIKAFKELEPLVAEVLKSEHLYLSDLIEEFTSLQDTNLKLYISSSARYFVVASTKELDRSGQFTIYAKDKQSFNLLYALLNSSYAYMWWRFLDGGILFAKRYLDKTPFCKSLLSLNGYFEDKVNKMIMSENNYLSYKMNAGKAQESIKFPEEYRFELNSILFSQYAKQMKLLHNNYEVT
ncbi:MAG: N-6 DNA methylase [Firmicutes bacterium]|nr:N-6 DNA methylase [Bacillota bacterium]